MNMGNNTDISYLEKFSQHKEIHEILDGLVEIFNQTIAFSTSFSYEDQIITHIICSEKLPIRIFTLDTGRHFEETYKVLNRTRERYQKEIEIFFPEKDEVESMVSSKGPFSFYESVENRKECCFIRKVKPLKRALKNVECWITGLRAAQSSHRSGLKQFEIDKQFNILKYNPLFNWSFDEVKKFIRDKNIPYNSLHDKGYISIGCQPCTRAVREGEDPRSGRWWWEQNSKKECGLHIKDS